MISAGLVIQPVPPLEFGFVVCVLCGRESDRIATRRLNTAYVDEASNWQCGCEDCYQKTIDYYRELWNESDKSIKEKLRSLHDPRINDPKFAQRVSGNHRGLHQTAATVLLRLSAGNPQA
jgi:hypothetical protein